MLHRFRRVMVRKVEVAPETLEMVEGVTLRDLSRRARVDIANLSRSLNGKAAMSQSSFERVVRVLEEIRNERQRRRR